MLKFKQITEYEPGIVFSLLSQSFAELWNDELEEKMKQFDKEVFENPDTVGACAFISTLNGKPVGMASWDPRQGPELGIIGYNCILPEYHGKGFGKAQIEEVLKRWKKQGFKKASVTTGQHPFFEPADKMYLACGFKETRRYNEGRDSRYGSIDYELELVKYPENVRIVEPTLELESEFFAMVEDFKTECRDIVDGIGSIDIENFTDSVRQTKDHAKGIGLPDGWVPASTYWLVCQKRIIGTCNLRHELNDFLREFGGHVGYSIRPSERRRGFGTQMLRLLLEKAQELGIERLLVTCDDNNIASARVIEKNGGKLADKVIKDDSKVPLRRYWIDLNFEV